MKPKPLVLAVLDGWGVAPDAEGNAITRANTPNMDRFIREFPAMTLYASGAEVGLDFGEMGNSEVGHLNIGAGRVYYQTLPRINKSIQDGSFHQQETFQKAAQHTRDNKSSLHIISLISPGNVHASQEHVHALVDFCKQQKLKKVFIHAVLDGRDTKFDSAADFIANLEAKLKEAKVGTIATLSGRQYAMDRDNRWERVEPAYRAMAEGVSKEYFKTPQEAIKASYAKEVYDEKFEPVVIGKAGKPTAVITDNDAVIFANFRPDRARELTKAFVLPGFPHFERTQIQNLYFTTMTEYEKALPVDVTFAPVVIHNCLAEVLSNAGLTQFHIAETEKYAHVTFFLNGTIEDPFAGEERQIISSPKVESYDLAPEMAAPEIGKATVAAIESGKYDTILMNFANADMVGHTGDYEATLKGVEAVDRALGDIADHTLARGGMLLITADHGNGEEVSNLETGDKDKEHSNNPVPFLIIGEQFRGQAGPAGDPPDGDLSLMHPVGMLADVAPTVLSLLGIEQPSEMTGRTLM